MNGFPHAQPKNAAENRATKHTAHHDWAGDIPLTATVISAVAEATEDDPTEMQPLNHCVDPDALDKLFSPRQDGTPRHGGSVTFDVNGRTVTVYSDGEVVVHG
jgi:hypothetical protein